MKGDPKPSFYYSAYRLKTLEQAASSSNETTRSPYLKALLSGKTKTTSRRVRIFPLADPYKKRHKNIPDKQASQVPEDIALKEKNWFHNYE